MTESTGPKRSRARRNYPVRLYISKEAGESVDGARIDVSHMTRIPVGKGEVADALCAIGARHLEEVAEYIREQRSKTDA